MNNYILSIWGADATITLSALAESAEEAEQKIKRQLSKLFRRFPSGTLLAFPIPSLTWTPAIATPSVPLYNGTAAVDTGQLTFTTTWNNTQTNAVPNATNGWTDIGMLFGSSVIY